MRCQIKLLMSDSTQQFRGYVLDTYILSLREGGYPSRRKNLITMITFPQRLTPLNAYT